MRCDAMRCGESTTFRHGCTYKYGDSSFSKPRERWVGAEAETDHVQTALGNPRGSDILYSDKYVAWFPAAKKKKSNKRIKCSQL